MEPIDTERVGTNIDINGRGKDNIFLIFFYKYN